MEAHELDISKKAAKLLLSHKADTFDISDIRRIAQKIAHTDIEDGLVYLPLDISEIEKYIRKQCSNEDFEDLDEFDVLLNEELKEIYSLLIHFLKKIQATVADIYKEKGNIVHSVSPTYEVPFDKGTLPFMWDEMHCNPDRAIKNVPKDRSGLEEEQTSPTHEYLVTERFVPLVKADKTRGTLVYAKNLSGYADLDSTINTSEEEAMGFLIDAMRGCEHLHNLGLVHRDIKLQNIMIVEDEDGVERGKLCDHEFVVKEGGKCERTISTQEYIDIAWYPYAMHTLGRASKEMDIFAFGMTLLFSYVDFDDREDFVEEFHTDFSIRFSIAFNDVQNKYEESELMEIFDQAHDMVAESIEDAIHEIRLLKMQNPSDPSRRLDFDIRELILGIIEKISPSTVIPENVLDLITRMLSYYREERPSLKEAISVLEQEYPAKLRATRAQLLSLLAQQTKLQ
ncbi:protein kinase [Patescibacteria group bacterium]